MVLVDTSVWIEFFRRGDSATAIELDRLLDEGSVLACGLVEAELLPGIRKQEREKVRNLMSGLPRLEIPADSWTDVMAIQEKALRNGVGPFSIPDLLIAATALRHNVAVFTRDQHFKAIAAVTGMTLHEKGD